MKCVVVGLGEFGRSVAVSFARNGMDVVAIDRELDLVARVKEHVSLAVALDASHLQALEAQDVGSADLLVAAIGENFEAQILLVVHAKQLGVPRVIARATTDDHQRILRAVGADIVLNPEHEAARHLVNKLVVPNISGYFELAEGFSVVEVEVPPKAVGQRLVDLDLRRKFQLNVIALKHRLADGAPDGASPRLDPVPAPDRQLEAGDIMSLVGNELSVAEFLAHYGG